jgi:uroporphyrinogen III methyltransferase / synthase
LQSYGLKADLVPEKFTSEALVEKLRSSGISGQSFLLARTDIAPDFLRKALLDYGADVHEMTIYRTVPGQTEVRKKRLEEWAGKRKIDFVTFTSSSTVRNFFESLTPKMRRQITGKFISIGPVTSQTLREYGVKPYREAESHTIPGLVEAITKS